MKSFKIEFVSHNQAVMIGRFMLIFSRRRIDVTNFSFRKLNEDDGLFIIEFNAEEWTAQNLVKQLSKQIDVFDVQLMS